jgi:hypothetical protein
MIHTTPGPLLVLLGLDGTRILLGKRIPLLQTLDISSTSTTAVKK